MKKLALLIGIAVGYVLGTRAGRERYDQISAQATKVWQNPKVQEKVEDAKAAAPELAHKASDTVKDTVKDAADTVKNKVTGHESVKSDGTYENATGAVEGDEIVVDETGFGPGGSKLP